MVFIKRSSGIIVTYIFYVLQAKLLTPDTTLKAHTGMTEPYDQAQG